MRLSKQIEKLNNALATLHAERNAAIFAEYDANPYATLADLSRKYGCSKSVVTRVREKHMATLPRVAAGKYRGWGY